MYINVLIYLILKLTECFNKILICIKMFQREPTHVSINIIKNASQAKVCVLYKIVLKKMKICNNHLWFNKMCLQKNIIPKYAVIKCRNNSKSAVRSVKKAQTFRIKE